MALCAVLKSSFSSKQLQIPALPVSASGTHPDLYDADLGFAFQNNMTSFQYC